MLNLPNSCGAYYWQIRSQSCCKAHSTVALWYAPTVDAPHTSTHMTCKWSTCRIWPSTVSQLVFFFVPFHKPQQQTTHCVCVESSIFNQYSLPYASVNPLLSMHTHTLLCVESMHAAGEMKYGERAMKWLCTQWAAIKDNVHRTNGWCYSSVIDVVSVVWECIQWYSTD